MKLRKLLTGTSAHPLPPPDPQCTQVTTRDRRCKLPKAPGSDKCAMHRNAK